MKFSIDPDHLHHAYLIAGDSTVVVPHIENFLITKLSFPVVGNPDYWRETQETFGIDESRAISEIHRGHPVVHSRRIIIIEAQSITHEAQNALLKVLEEPVSHTHFFLIVPNESDLLPTVLSRLFIIKNEQSDSDATLGKNFLNMSISDRMVFVSKLAENKEKKQIDMFIRSLIFAFRPYLTANTLDSHIYMEKLLAVHEYIRSRGASVKALLEYVALAVPKNFR